MRQVTLSLSGTPVLHRLATEVPFIACLINSLNILDLWNFLLESGLPYFIVLSTCLSGLFRECYRMSLL